MKLFPCRKIDDKANYLAFYARQSGKLHLEENLESAIKKW